MTIMLLFGNVNNDQNIEAEVLQLTLKHVHASI